MIVNLYGLVILESFSQKAKDQSEDKVLLLWQLGTI